MGRSELGVKGVYCWLGVDQPNRIDALVGKQKRSEFIREAIDREIKRRERQKP